MNILVMNAGGSSLKMCLYAMQDLRPLEQPEQVLGVAVIERIGGDDARLTITVGQGDEESRQIAARDVAHAAEQMLDLLLSAEAEEGGKQRIDAVGHRVVHGGPSFVAPARVDGGVIAQLREITELDPLHMPGCIAGIAAGIRILPDAAAVAVFDTAFHHDLPPIAARYALPNALAETHHLRRYGFHGISYRYVTQRTLQALGREAAGTRLILCHLGGGASVCAVRDGRSVDTSMGFTPLEGLIMGTRCGDIDPGLALYLVRALKLSAEEVASLLNKEAGLQGLSGRSSDTRDLEEAAAQGDAASAFALEAFAYRVRKYIGAYAAALGGVDALVFTDKIGAHGFASRARICAELAFLGLDLAPARNVDVTGSDPLAIGTGDGRRVWVVPTDEERQIARETFSLLN